MNIRVIVSTVALGAVLTGIGVAEAAKKNDERLIERGRYLVTLGGCNDCHTPGFAQQDGKVPESEWLVGNAVGFQGPWGTTYPANLRLVLGTMSEEQWIQHARTPRRPPMPWFNLAKTGDDDLRAMYRYITSLGVAGNAAPAYAPPGQPVATPYIEFFPKNLPTHAMK
jgi:mono/diheme cytochrome c family protein